MKVFYDGSFEGFLTLVYDVYYEALNPSSIMKSEPKELLFEPLHLIFTDETKAHKVLFALKKKIFKRELSAHFSYLFMR